MQREVCNLATVRVWAIRTERLGDEDLLVVDQHEVSEHVDGSDRWERQLARLRPD